MQITVYGTKTCVYCYSLKQWLRKEGHEFTEKFVDEDMSAAKEMVEISGQNGVPFTIIKHDDSDTIEGVMGFDRITIDSIIKKQAN